MGRHSKKKHPHRNEWPVAALESRYEKARRAAQEHQWKCRACFVGRLWCDENARLQIARLNAREALLLATRRKG
jgi:hypothetical protein